MKNIVKKESGSSWSAEAFELIHKLFHEEGTPKDAQVGARGRDVRGVVLLGVSGRDSEADSVPRRAARCRGREPRLRP